MISFCKSRMRALTPVDFLEQRRVKQCRGARSILIVCLTLLYATLIQQ